MAVLVAKGDFQNAILNYINSLEAPELFKKIVSGEKNISDCCDWIVEEMRRRESNGVAVASDKEVYGLAVHYFEEDSIKAGVHTSDKKVKVAVPTLKKEVVKEPKAAAVQKSNDLEGQMSLFDL